MGPDFVRHCFLSCTALLPILTKSIPWYAWIRNGIIETVICISLKKVNFWQYMYFIQSLIVLEANRLEPRSNPTNVCNFIKINPYLFPAFYSSSNMFAKLIQAKLDLNYRDHRLSIFVSTVTFDTASIAWFIYYINLFHFFNLQKLLMSMH